MSLKKIFSSTWFVLIMLCSLFFMEWLTFCRLENVLPYSMRKICVCWIIFGWVILCSLFIMGLLTRTYRLNVQIVKRFLNNALALKWLSVVFIFSFLIQLALITELAYSILIKNELNWLQLLIAVSGALYLCAIFPIKSKNKNIVEDKSKRTLLITGLTVPISERSFDLLFKPFEEIAGYNNIKDVVILISTKLYEQATPVHQSILSLKKIAAETDNQDLNVLTDKLPLPRGLAYDLGKIDDIIHDDSGWITSYLSCLKEENHNKINEMLVNIMTRYLRVKYPKYAEKNVTFHLTDAHYDYNDFDNCFNGIGEVLKNYEKNRKNGTRETLIHISPGTSVVSAAMSIHAIKEFRSLVYTKQVIPPTLTSFDINVWNTQEILKELWKEIEE